MIISKTSHSIKSISSHYNELDEFYRSFWGDHLHHGLWLTGKESPQQAVRQLIEHAVERLRIEPGMHVCDVGCGYGATARMLAQQWKAKVTAFTISEKQYRYAVSKNCHEKNPPTYHLKDWLCNDLPSKTMDRIIAIESSEHFDDKPAFFKEAHRLLVPGGRVAVFAWLTKESPSTFDMRYLLEPICREGCLPSMGSKEEYLSLMRNSGFSDIQYEDLSRKVDKTWTICIQQVIKGFFINPNFRSFLLSPSFNRNFAKSVFRIRLAYAKGCMRYGLFIGKNQIIR